MQKSELPLKQQSNQMRRLVAIPLLAAIAFILQYLEFPLPVVPSFLKLDFSTLPGLFGGLMFGPVAGILIELIKNALHLMLKNTDGLLVGEFANFVAGSCFIYAVVMLQRWRKGRGGLVAGFALGTILMTAFMSVANMYVLIPTYAALYQMPIESFLQTFQMDSMWSIILYGIAPFNVLKGIAISLVAYLIFIKIEPRLKVNA